MTLEEVLEMEPNFKKLYGTDKGFKQYVDLYNQKAFLKEIRELYEREKIHDAVAHVERMALMAEGQKIGEEKGQKIGEEKGKKDTFISNMPILFELLKINPKKWQEVIELGLNAGVDEPTIRKKYKQWLKIRG